MDSQRISICIGINQYKNFPAKSLKYSVSDAEKVHDILQDRDRGAFNQSHLLADEMATQASIDSLLEDTLTDSNLGKQDLVLFYFSGHAKLDNLNNLYLIPHDIEPKTNNPNEYKMRSVIHATDILRSVSNTGVGTIIFILDACFSGASGSILTSLEFNAIENIHFIGAARSFQEAYEYPELNQSLFTHWLLRAFYEHPLIDDWITLQQAIAFVDREIRKYGLREQRIQTTTQTINHNIFLVRNPRYTLNEASFIEEIKRLHVIGQYPISTDIDFDFPPSFFVVEKMAFGVRERTLVCCFNNETVQVSVQEADNARKIAQDLLAQNYIVSMRVVTKKELASQLMPSFGYPTHCLTHVQMLTNLIDFRGYMSELLAQYYSGNKDRKHLPSLKEVHVPLDARIVPGNSTPSPRLPVYDLIESWLKNDNEPLMIILGGYGTGKTTVGRMISYNLAEQWRENQNKSVRIPIFIPLRLFHKVPVDLPKFLVAFLSEYDGLTDVNFRMLQRMNKAGMLLFIFDGFDEIGTNVNKKILKQNFRAICELAGTRNEKIIITSRPEAFLSDTEQRQALEIASYLHAKKPPLTIELVPFSDNQFNEYLRKSISWHNNRPHVTQLQWLFFKEKIESIPDLKNVTRRPVLLEITVKALPKLLAENSPVTKSNLYENYLDQEIKRQVYDKGRFFKIDEKKTRLNLVEHIALFLLSKDSIEITIHDIQKIVSYHIAKTDHYTLEEFTRDFIDCSFLERELDSYRFSHLSFMEFLIARYLVREEIIKGQFNILGKIRLKPNIVHFVADLLLEQESNNSNVRELLWSWMSIDRLKRRNARLWLQNKEAFFDVARQRIIEYEGTNLELVLNQLIEEYDNYGEDRILGSLGSDEFLDSLPKRWGIRNRRWGIENYVLSKTSLDLGDRDLDKLLKALKLELSHDIENLFEGSNDEPTSFIGGNAFSLLVKMGESMEGKDLSDMNLSSAVLGNITFADTDLTGTSLALAYLGNVIFRRAKLENSRFENTNLGNVRFQNTEMTRAHFNHSDFGNVSFENSNLQECGFNDSDFGNIEFLETTISKCNFAKSGFGNLQIEDSIIDDVNFAETDWGTIEFNKKVSIKSSNFLKAKNTSVAVDGELIIENTEADHFFSKRSMEIKENVNETKSVN